MTEQPDFTAHLCLRGRSCRANDPPAITEQPGTFCPECDKHLRSVIRQLPEHWLELHAHIGDHSASSDRDRRVRIRSTRTPPIPINTTREALAAEIIEVTDHAAAIISDRLGFHPEPKDRYVASRMPPGRRRDSGRFRCNEHDRLTRYVQLIAPNLELLAAQTDEDHTWAMRWNPDGTTIELTQTTGLQVIDNITRLHDKIRGELGKRLLRHRYSLPCPRCGGELGRYDGQTVITCPDTWGGCGSAWTEREYRWLVGLTVERKEMDINRWLLAEAYARLDSIQHLIDKASESPVELLEPGAGLVVLEELQKRVHGHARPQERASGSTHSAATARQEAEEQWAWSGERPYRPPKRRKHTRPAGPPEHPIAAVSCLLVADDPTYTGQPVSPTTVCPDCNTIHAGEC